jgi:hypothetical protein
MDGTLGDIRSTLVNNNIKLVDCHCHIAPPHFPEEQIADVVNEANLANIAAIINVCLAYSARSSPSSTVYLLTLALAH